MTIEFSSIKIVHRWACSLGYRSGELRENDIREPREAVTGFIYIYIINDMTRQHTVPS